MKRNWRFLRSAGAILLLCFLLAACGGKDGNGAAEEQSVPYSEEQMLLLVASERKQAENLYTERIWEVKTGASGRRYEEAFYEEMKRFFVEMTAMNGIAAERGVKLDAGEKKALSQAAETFYQTSVRGQEALQAMSPEDTEEMFRQYALAIKLRRSMLEDRRAEVSESEAKVIRIQQIRTPDENTAMQIFDRAQGGADLYALAKAYDTERSTALKVGRGDLPKQLEDAAFSLEDGQVGDPVLYDGQYYIFKAVDSYDETETAMRRQGLQSKRLQDIVREAYRVYQKKHRITMDARNWEQVVQKAGFSYSGENFFTAVKEALDHEGL
ncbi:MAG: peptidyl-prolyl cis-trans isomerase [Stomatobaculum sp.]|nr:peptidyl-prolyl cis-trans isomerase [Stomatobaculum sp.]